MRHAKRRIRNTTVALAVLAAAGAYAVTTQGAANGTVAKPKAGEALTVVQDGLNNVRKVTFDPQSGKLLVAESGKSSAACIGDSANGCFSKSGSVFAYDPQSGSGSRTVTGLPALKKTNGQMTGLVETAPFSNGSASAVFGLGGMSTQVRDGFGADAEVLGQYATVKDGGAAGVADAVAFEEAENPDGSHVDSNAFGLSAKGSGAVVVDAAGNDVLKVAADGSIEVLAVLPEFEWEGKSMESVPTAVVQGPDGAYYVGELGGYPSVGGARVWRIVPGQQPEKYASGFTTITDLGFDEKGRLLVLEMAAKGMTSPDKTGRLVRIKEDGSHEVIASTGLEHPGGLAVASNGDIYVTNRMSSTTDGTGQLLKIRTDS